MFDGAISGVSKYWSQHKGLPVRPQETAPAGADLCHSDRNIQSSSPSSSELLEDELLDEFEELLLDELEFEFEFEFEEEFELEFDCELLFALDDELLFEFDDELLLEFELEFDPPSSLCCHHLR